MQSTCPVTPLFHPRVQELIDNGKMETHPMEMALHQPWMEDSSDRCPFEHPHHIMIENFKTGEKLPLEKIRHSIKKALLHGGLDLLQDNIHFYYNPRVVLDAIDLAHFMTNKEDSAEKMGMFIYILSVDALDERFWDYLFFLAVDLMFHCRFMPHSEALDYFRVLLQSGKLSAKRHAVWVALETVRMSIQDGGQQERLESLKNLVKKELLGIDTE